MSSLLQNRRLCTRPAAEQASLIVGMEFTIESWTSLLQRVLYTKGEELVCLSMQGKRSKQRVHGRCKD